MAICFAGAMHCSYFYQWDIFNELLYEVRGENKQKYEDISEIGFPETEADHEEENDQQDVKHSDTGYRYQLSGCAGCR